MLHFLSRRTTIVVRAFFVLLFLFALLLESGSAQLFRRLRRMDRQVPANSPYRVGQDELPDPTGEGPLIRGDGRFLQRAEQLFAMFTESGSELKPVAIISLAGFDEFKRVFQLTAEEIRHSRGSNEEPQWLNAFLQLYQWMIEKGFDTAQPIGIMIQTDGVLYYPLLFTPMDVQSRIGQAFLDRYTELLPDGRRILQQELFAWPLGQLYVQEHNGWVFIASEAQLNSLPGNPAVLLQGLDHAHLVAARFELKNLPPLTTRAALSFGEMQAVAQAETELEKAAARLGIGYLRSLAEQADRIDYTLSYDEKNHEYVLSQTEHVRPKTERAALLNQRREAQSVYHGFHHPESAIFATHLVMYLTRLQRQQLEIILDETIGRRLLTDQERAEFKQQSAAQFKEEPAKEPAKNEPKPRRRLSRPRKIETASPPSPPPSPVEEQPAPSQPATPELAPPEPVEQEKMEIQPTPTPTPTPTQAPAKEPTDWSLEDGPILAPPIPEQKHTVHKTPIDKTLPDDKKEPAEQSHQSVLASLLSKVSPEKLHQQIAESQAAENEQEEPIGWASSSDYPTGLPLDELPHGELDNSAKLELLLRRIGVCYYWALVGSVREGLFDGAMTCSKEHGILGAYSIPEGARFNRALDDIFREFQLAFPDFYAKNVERNYLQADGFLLTRIRFSAGDLSSKSVLGSLLPLRTGSRETSLILGVRNDSVCFAIRQGARPEEELLAAIAAMEKPLPVYDLFFVFSGYELVHALARTGRDDTFGFFQAAALKADPNARAYGTTRLTDSSRTITLRISALLTPSLWRLRDTIRTSRNW